MNFLGWDFLFDADCSAIDRTVAAARKLITVGEVTEAQKRKDKG